MLNTYPELSKLAEVAAISLAVMTVAIADALIKKASSQSSLMATSLSPYLFWAVSLYILQIGIFTYAFIAGWKLSLIGALQTALYALIVLAAGRLFFKNSSET